jgi:two-component system cell cycle response regulator CpdR
MPEHWWTMSTTPTGGPGPTIRLRVLLVEDNDAASRGLARLLEAWGYDVTVRHDGTSAIRTLETDPPPDFVLTDLRLPDLDGREIAQHARRLVPPPRIALITGWDIGEELSDLHTSWGIDWFFPKPLEMASLIARLREPRAQDQEE